MKSLTVVVTFFIWSLNIFSQQVGHLDRCHATEHHHENLQNHDYANAFEQRMAAMKSWLKTHKVESKMDCDEILYLPVAVHFQRPAGGGSIGITAACAEEMALSQIAATNADFAGTNTDISNWIDGQATWPGINNGESCIQFCLATLNHPAGSGIAEGNYAITIDEFDDSQDNIPGWGGYMNWAVRDMDNPLGFAPLAANGGEAAAVCGLPYFGTSNCNGTLSPTFNLGRTMTHEVGHYLSLPHPFDSGNCTADGDGVADTPFTDNSTFGCPGIGESIINCTEPVLFPTFMEYCDDACLYMFTEQQVEQMEAHVNANLQNLLNNSTTVCEEAACIGKELVVTTTEESCLTGGDGDIELNYTGGAAPIQYSFDGGTSFQGSNSLENTVASTYEIVAIDAAGCELTQTVNLERESPGLNVATLSNAFCGNPDGSLTAAAALNDEFEYNLGAGWQDSTFFDGLAADIYTLSIRNDVGCTEQIEVIVEDDTDLNLSINRLRPINCPLFDNGLIDAAVPNGVPPLEFRLDNGEPQENGVYENLSQGQYLLTVEDQRGCKESFEFSIGISFANIASDCPCEFFIPNAMTPGDGDDLNNVFKPIPSCPVTDYSLAIFDRLGDLVFETDNQDEVWNGGEGGFFGQSQIYYYRVNYRWGEERNESLDLFEKTGFIMVLR